MQSRRDARKDESFNIVADIKHETARAYLVIVAGEEHWIPKSLCMIDDTAADFDPDARVDVSFDMPRWLAEEKGFCDAED